jgi:hypothetical protein
MVQPIEVIASEEVLGAFFILIIGQMDETYLKDIAYVRFVRMRMFCE